MNRPSLLVTLSQLRDLRARNVDALGSQLAQQQQQVRRYHSNIEALTRLGEISARMEPAQLGNLARYKTHLQRLVNGQRQAVQLAEQQQQVLQAQLLDEACKEKRFALMLAQQRDAQAQEAQRQQQALTDDCALQCWLRNRRQKA
ncbi:flagellar export protein FliJ [Pantoea sp. Mb-10]|uniref:flagellar export protein FliJ n=1 Tax=unclassified Pantoea TaxID=2630326 RepID=UPI001E37EB58|nr:MULTISPECIES: flagellar export protein FliJ [unclassified Pantoea]MCE0489877.1 flagellar export protein FliJ [Pantoea sp. Mb-10]MCE0501017.1 flagellar export protein FliJ [Pantoea sp. Pb-8]